MNQFILINDATIELKYLLSFSSFITMLVFDEEVGNCASGLTEVVIKIDELPTAGCTKFESFSSGSISSSSSSSSEYPAPTPTNSSAGKLNFLSGFCVTAKFLIISAIFSRLCFTVSFGNQLFKLVIGRAKLLIGV